MSSSIALHLGFFRQGFFKKQNNKKPLKKQNKQKTNNKAELAHVARPAGQQAQASSYSPHSAE